MRTIYSIIIFLFSVISVFAQTEESNKYFNQGMELYNQGKYTEAVPCFEKSDSIDKITLDSTSNRRDYSAMWLASCYYRLGKESVASNIHKNYNDIPINRNLTILSDSLASKTTKISDITEIINLWEQVADIEETKIGKSHSYRANTLLNLAYCQLGIKDIQAAKKTFEEIYYIATVNRNVKFTSDELTILFAMILRNCSTMDEYSKLIDKMIYIASLSIKENNLWSSLIADKVMSLRNNKMDDDAYRYICQKYEEINSKKVINANLFELNSLMANALWIKIKKNNIEGEKIAFQNKRMSIYNDMLHVSEQLWGNKSFEYGNVLFKLAATYLGNGLKLNIKKGKELLFKAFDIMTDSVNANSHIDEVEELLRYSQVIFDIADANENFLDYSQKIINILPEDFDKNSLMENVAKALNGSPKEENKLRAITIYSDLIEKNANDTPKKIKYLKERAFRYRMLKETRKSLNDYLAVDSLYKVQGVAKNFVEESEQINIKEEIAKAYLATSDTVNYQKNHKVYCGLCENLIDRIINNKVAPLGSEVDDDYKLDIIHDYANSLVNINSDSLDLKKSTAYFTLILTVLDKFNPFVLSKKQLKKNTFAFLANIFCKQKEFAKGMFYAKSLYDEALADGDTTNIISSLNKFALLYKYVSIEPEKSLYYRLKSCELESQQLINRKDNMLKEEFATSYETFMWDWTNCAELYEYLGDEESSNNCYSKLLSSIRKIEGTLNSNYSEKMYDWLNYKLRKELGQTKNSQKIHLLCDSLAIYYKNNSMFLNWKYYNYGSIAQNYFFAKDTIKAKQYYKLYENEIQTKYGDKYQTSKEYIELQRTLADVLPLKEKIVRLKDIEVIYSKLGKDKHNELLHDLVYCLKENRDSKEELLYLEKIKSLFPNDNYALHRLTDCYRNSGEYLKIASLYDTLCKVSKNELFSDIKSGTAEYREAIWKLYYDIPFCLGEALAKKIGKNISAATIFDNIVLRKNFLLNASISAENLIKSDGDSLLLAKYERKVRLEQKLRESNSNIIEDLGRSISREQAQKLVTRFNDEIMERAAILGDYTSSLFVDWKTIQKNLGKDDIAIEFSKYNSFDNKPSYGAAILQNVGEPIFIELCKEDEINSIPKTKLYTSSNLYEIIWKPLERYFANKKNIYFSPDGQLFNIAIEVVAGENGSSSIGERYNVCRVTSTRELTQKGSNRTYKKAVIYGGLRYNIDAKTLETDSKKYPLRDFSVKSFEIADSLQLRSGVEYLPATKEEALNIDKKLEIIHINTKLLIDSIGTETSFKNLSGSNLNILHIATHGFYWTKTEAQQRNDLSFLTLLKQGKKDNTEDKALTRSGLLFAGANNALMGRRLPYGIDDGILTAKEISELDLRGLDLVVLSACQTGLGEITGDGVFGLQRGFKKAGAKTLMMSLWKVDDKATQLLMSRFYSNLITGKSKIESLRDAQKYVREYETEVEVKPDNRPVISAHAKEQVQQNKTTQKIIKKVQPYKDPKYWAAFILLDALN